MVYLSGRLCVGGPSSGQVSCPCKDSFQTLRVMEEPESLVMVIGMACPSWAPGTEISRMTPFLTTGAMPDEAVVRALTHFTSKLSGLREDCSSKVCQRSRLSSSHQLGGGGTSVPTLGA